jgi:3-deoxy-7-phosphoheptulonate synthase
VTVTIAHAQTSEPVSDSTWSPQGWRARPAAQQPVWDEAELEGALSELRGLPPLIFAGEARRLREALARASRGEAFVLQAGDCVESFSDFSADAIRDKLRLILQMAVVIAFGSGMPVVKIGRIAGQFAKPRSSAYEAVGGEELPSFRGEAVNDPTFDRDARRADPRRLLRAYDHSVAKMNLIRAFTKGGFADLRRLHSWNRDFVASGTVGKKYARLTAQIERSLRFMAAWGVDVEHDPKLQEVDFFTSHEALILGYEEALTRRESLTDGWYACSAHFLWAGERTRAPDGAHIAFLSGVENPVGVKLGPGAQAEEVLELCSRLNPERQPGRLALITRLGRSEVERVLPGLVSAVHASGEPVVWICDPMHGNTVTAPGGLKTRRFADIVAEIRQFFAVHRQVGTVPAGIHLELTHEDVTECIGGSEKITSRRLRDRYRTLCDPRLNAHQALEIAFELGGILEAGAQAA